MYTLIPSENGQSLLSSERPSSCLSLSLLKICIFVHILCVNCLFCQLGLDKKIPDSMDETPFKPSSQDSFVFPKAELSIILVCEGPEVSLKAACFLFKFKFIFQLECKYTFAITPYTTYHAVHLYFPVLALYH